jgi:hypothetical protein
LPTGFTPFHGFCCLPDNSRVLGVSFGFVAFFFSFLENVLDENVYHVDVLLKLGDVHVAFGILFDVSHKGLLICFVFFRPFQVSDASSFPLTLLSCKFSKGF